MWLCALLCVLNYLELAIRFTNSVRVLQVPLIIVYLKAATLLHVHQREILGKDLSYREIFVSILSANIPEQHWNVTESRQIRLVSRDVKLRYCCLFTISTYCCHKGTFPLWKDHVIINRFLNVLLRTQSVEIRLKMQMESSKRKRYAL